MGRGKGKFLPGCALECGRAELCSSLDLRDERARPAPNRREGVSEGEG